MATLGHTVLSLADISKTLDPNGSPAMIAEMLSQKIPVMQDMKWREGNLLHGHQVTIRTGLPTVYWRIVNRGVLPSASTSAQITESCGEAVTMGEMDKSVAETGGNLAANRANESKTHIMAMGQEVSSTIWYGNASVSPEEMNGIAVRYSSSTANSADNLILAGGAGSDNTSIYLINWGENVFGIFPKGSQAGLEHIPKDLETIEDVNAVAGTRMLGYRDYFYWKAGLVVKDWRYAARAANIDVSLLQGNSSPADLYDLMTFMTHRVEGLEEGDGTPVFYMNRTVAEMLDVQARDNVKTGGQLSYSVVEGKRILTFRGIPIKVTDSILDSETLVA